MSEAADFKRVIVLGHSGFVGKQILEHLAFLHPGIEMEGLATSRVDLTQPDAATRLGKYFTRESCIVMCSGIKSNYGSTLDNYVKNAAMAENVCRALANNPVRKFLFLSSIAVYGVDKHDTAITEDTEVIPDTYYGLSKYVSETLLRLQFASTKGEGLIILRIPSVFGPQERIVAPTPSGFLTTYLNGGEVTIWGDGSERREFLFVDDLARLIDELLFGGFSGLLNVSNGIGTSYRGALDIISRLLRREIVIHSKPRTKPQIDKLYDNTRLCSVLPQFQFTSLEEGLRRIAEAQRINAW